MSEPSFLCAEIVLLLISLSGVALLILMFVAVIFELKYGGMNGIRAGRHRDS